MLDLLFRRCTRTNDSLFDLSRGIFVDFNAVREGRADGGRPRVAKFQRASSILVHEYTFNGDNIRTKLVDDAANRFKNLPQAICKSAIDAFYGSAGNVKRPVPVEINDAEARQAGARINTEYASFGSQLSLRSVPVFLR